MAKDATKVVVRLLPPLITEDELLSTISEESQKNAATRVFIPGKRHKGEKASRNAVCYFNFSLEEHAEVFIKEYHGHQFVDDQGEQFRAVACYAPYQKAPKKKEAKDTREGTIEDDAAYKEFVESLSKPKDAFVAPEDPKLSLKPTEPGNTPLLQHIKNKAKERRARLEKRKNQRWREGGLEYIAEEETGSSKKAKWHCSECGTSKNLEEDPDDRGSFYCSRCWESWEASYASVPTKKKKKKHSYYEDDYDAEEPAADSTSKKSKKKRQKEAAADDWGTTKTSKEEGTESKHRRKKKDKYEEYWEEEPSSYWRAKKKDSYAEEEEYPKSKKDKKHRDQWAEEDEKQSRHKKGSKHDKGEGGVVVSRWKAKKSGEEEGYEKEEKPRHGRRKDRDSDSGAQWVPKNR